MKAALRRPLVVGNWKLHKTLGDSRALASALREQIPAGSAAAVAVAPVFTALRTVYEALSGSAIGLAAQDVYYEAQGAFTGEVSAPLLKDVGCSLVIVGHSERRALFGETDEVVRKKALAAIGAGLTPIVCVGETLAERESGASEAVVLRQITAVFEGMAPEAAGVAVVAYEPVWAIGTGRTASPGDAQAMHAAIRQRVAALQGQPLADRLRILYGGSVKADNARALMAEPDVDGALVGGASLEARSFAAIVAGAEA